jgi:hypothetical protein
MVDDMTHERLEMDKLDASLTVRIPEHTAVLVGKLPKHWNDRLNNRLRVTIASVLHEAAFDPSVYLCSEYKERRREAR